MIVLTDGASGDDPEVGANAARAEGITMMAIGVGNAIQFEELLSIANRPEYVSTMSSFDDLVAAVGIFSWEMCDIVNKLTLSPTQAEEFECLSNVEICQSRVETLVNQLHRRE